MTWLNGASVREEAEAKVVEVEKKMAEYKDTAASSGLDQPASILRVTDARRPNAPLVDAGSTVPLQSPVVRLRPVVSMPSSEPDGVNLRTLAINAENPEAHAIRLIRFQFCLEAFFEETMSYPGGSVAPNPGIDHAPFCECDCRLSVSIRDVRAHLSSGLDARAAPGVWWFNGGDGSGAGDFHGGTGAGQLLGRPVEYAQTRPRTRSVCTACWN